MDEGDNGLWDGVVASQVLAWTEIVTRKSDRHPDRQVCRCSKYKTRYCKMFYLVILDDVRVVSRDALLLGKGLNVLLLRNHNSHQEALQQQQQQAD